MKSENVSRAAGRVIGEEISTRDTMLTTIATIGGAVATAVAWAATHREQSA
jgi:hypothetical protein